MSLAVVALLLFVTGLTVNVDAFPAQSSFTYYNLVARMHQLRNNNNRLKMDLGVPLTLNLDTYRNTALRLSKALNDEAKELEGADHMIDRDAVTAGSCDVDSEEVDSSITGEQFIVKPRFFKCYLQAVWGDPDEPNVNTPDDISTQKGVLIFTGCPTDQQRILLWDGETDQCFYQSCPSSYFAGCSTVAFYELS